MATMKQVTFDKIAGVADGLTATGTSDVTQSWIDPTISSGFPHFLYGGHQFTDAWTAGSGNFRWSLHWDFSSLTVRNVSASFAIYIDQMNFSPSGSTEFRKGLWWLRCEDDALADLGHKLGAQTEQDTATARNIYLRDFTTLTNSDESLTLNLYFKRWLIFYVEAKSENTATSGVYDVTCTQRVYLDEGGHRTQLAFQELTSADTDPNVFGFSEFNIGMNNGQKNQDTFTIYLDELRVTDSSIINADAFVSRSPLPRDRFLAYPVQIYNGVSTVVPAVPEAILTEGGEPLSAELGTVITGWLVTEGPATFDELLADPEYDDILAETGVQLLKEDGSDLKTENPGPTTALLQEDGDKLRL